MKIITAIIITLLSSVLLSQVNFELDFTCDKINHDDDINDVQIFDYNGDSEDEIIIEYWNESLREMRVVVYLNNGIILNQFNIEIDYSYTPGKSYVFKSYGNNFGLFTIYNTELPIMDLSIYDIDSGNIINSISFQEESDFRFNWIRSIFKTTISDTTFFSVGASAGDWTTLERFHSYSYKFSFINNQINYVEKTQDCGLEQIPYGENHIFSSGSFIESGGMAWGYTEAEYYLKKITNEINSSVIDLYECSGTCAYTNPMTFNNYPTNFLILTKNCDLSSTQVIYYLTTDTDDGTITHFKAFDSEDCFEVWSSTDSYIGNDYITASSQINVNTEDHYLLYFRGNLLEIRNRLNGNIIHHQTSSISPFNIKRKSDEELLFFVEREDETGFDVYTLESEIQVSAENYELPVSNYELRNYPNPFNPSTTISFETTNVHEFAQIEIYNLKGQKVKTLSSNPASVILSPSKDEGQRESNYNAVWNGLDENNEPVSSGVYFYKLKVDNKTVDTKKMLLLK